MSSSSRLYSRANSLAATSSSPKSSIIIGYQLQYVMYDKVRDVYTRTLKSAQLTEPRNLFFHKV